MPVAASPRFLLRTTAWLFAGTALLAPAVSAQGVKPLFELFGTFGRPALAPSVAEVYAPAGGVQAGGGVGAPSCHWPT